MWIELKNLDTGQGENVNLLQVARCMKATNNTIKCEFPNGSLVRYNITYQEVQKLYTEYWQELTRSKKRNETPKNDKHDKQDKEPGRNKKMV